MLANFSIWLDSNTFTKLNDFIDRIWNNGYSVQGPHALFLSVCMSVEWPLSFEPRLEKTGFLPRRKQRRRSASQSLQS